MVGVDIVEGCRLVLEGLDRVVVGYREEKRVLLAAALANGHVLLEGVPGIAKTTLVKAFARLLGLHEGVKRVVRGVEYRGFSRIQFTPDLLPSDVTGSLVFNPATREFEVKLGPIFTYILLADEINRAVPRTQAALLEAMQERQVTIGGRTFPLEVREEGKFFLVFATQNPVEQEGTYPLPEAQLDRFIVRIIMGYPESLEEEKEVYKLHRGRLREPLEELEPVVEPSWLVEAQEEAARVEVGEEVLDYVARLVRATRPEQFPPAADYFELGASPRAGIALVRVAQAYALLEGRTRVEVADIQRVTFHVLNHRLVPRIEAVVEYEERYGGRYHARLAVIREGLREAMKAAGG